MSLMIERIRKGAKAHVYLREWREYLQKTGKTGLTAIAMAERLEIERESYYRLERNPKTLSVAEVAELADAMGIDPQRLWEPPPEVGKKVRPSLDAIVKGVDDEQAEGLADMLRRAVGQNGR